MHRRILLAGAALALAAAAQPAGAQTRTEIQFWYGLGGALGERVQEQVARFNASQDRYTVTATFRGSYVEVMTGAIAAWRAGNPPHIAQVFEVGTATMMAAGPAIKPVWQLAQESGIAIDPARYLAGVRGYYSDTQGRLVSMPHNSSSALMWVNLDAFEKAGVREIPRTWREVRAAAEKLKAASATPCVMTTTWPTWVMFEQQSSIHDVGLATKANGFEGMDAELNLTHPFFLKHVQFLADLQRDGLFRYGGRDNAAGNLFPSGECAISFGSSAARAQIERDAKFRWASVPLPYHDDVIQTPRNGVIGGASLWALTARNRTPAEYAAVAAFYAFISRPEEDQWWHQVTGYVPLTLAAYEKAKAEGYYERNPGADAAIIQLSRAEPTPNSQGFRLGGFVEIRNIIQEELEKVFQGQQTVPQALETANRRGNAVLRAFERANRS
ncbi:sn-glycerol-3-phosphate ABC transporter substrate-binding protein UgpB [Elioraea sp.]|uniref:sn-glycerol-3-phosphate ABC transporter substrate-binding protein UgpB n=1 Tax=Elioraea sp. TaxID=2185103 RepID=UPI0021DD8CA8|nr:sn-glycerol-3-phosphate ABC transporter substrate-binding protein UgpB [Elioraea sp.]GIX09231.1 MAG: ABC transporter substrate-binding protein [Elioraea sp.]